MQKYTTTYFRKHHLNKSCHLKCVYISDASGSVTFLLISSKLKVKLNVAGMLLVFSYLVINIHDNLILGITRSIVSHPQSIIMSVVS